MKQPNSNVMTRGLLTFPIIERLARQVGQSHSDHRADLFFSLCQSEYRDGFTQLTLPVDEVRNVTAR
jgi:hypothetical protein